ncbi:MAG: TatD family hydrolase [Polyangiaceae bacterium]
MLPALVDIGVNLAHARFRNDRDEVIARALAAGVPQMILTGTSEPASEAVLSLAKKRRGTLYSTAGVHPHDAKSCGPRTIDALRALCRNAEVVAVGECGLDFNRNFSPPPVQERWFTEQLALAAEMKLPVFLHERDAHDRFLAIVREQRASLCGGVVHCFTGTAAEAKAYLDLDLDLGITGWICDDRRGVGLRDVVKRVPLSRLMVETDAPFLTPRDLSPRPDRNEPAFLPHVLRAVAASMGLPAEEVAAATTATAHRLFAKMKD